MKEKIDYSQSPSMDNLAEGIAAHFLNPSIKPPISVGIAGECGSGDVVTSLMTKIEAHLLLTAAQAAFPLKDFNRKKGTDLSGNDGRIVKDSNGEQRLSEKGKRIEKGVTNFWLKQNPGEDKAKEQVQVDREHKKKEQETALVQFLEKYRPEHEAVFKSLACMELNQLVKDPEHKSNEKSPEIANESNETSLEIARVLTVKFSAGHYTGTLEACDGLVFEITKSIEKSMTRAQRWSTRCRNNRQSFFTKIDLLIPVIIFAVIYAAWMFIERFDFTKLKSGTIPAFVIAIGASALKKSVSFYNWKQVSGFVSDHFSSHKSKQQYGQQQTVISKIKFLKEEIGRKPYPVFSLITGEKFKIWRCFKDEKIENTCVPKFGSAPHKQLRIIVFLTGLNRYEDSAIVQVLQSLNTVLKACEINFVLALDKTIIRRALKTSSQQEDADHFISQIIKLPVTILHPTVTLLHTAVKTNSEMQENTANDIEKQLPSANEISTANDLKCKMQLLSKRVTQVRDISTMKNNDEEITFGRLNCFAREISGLHQNYMKYHKFAWNVISQTMGHATNTSWQWDKELVAWIFICSQWRGEMNILIQDWHDHVDVNEEDEKIKQEPSLKEIVANYIKKQPDAKEKEKNAADSKDKGNKEADSKEEEKETENILNGDLQGWKSLHKALDKVQDVSMNGIQCFQHFRFHCNAGYLNRPLELSSN